MNAEHSPMLGRKGLGLLLVLALAMLFALGVAGLVATEAPAHDNDAHSVVIQNGNEYLWYDEYTKYDGALDGSKAAWNELNCRWNSTTCPGVSVRFSGDQAARLVVRDYSNCDSSTIGRYRSSTSPDQILLNVCLMQPREPWERMSVTTHEMGHAIDFYHPPDTAYYKDNAILYYCPICTRYSTPIPHDDEDYYYRWVG